MARAEEATVTDAPSEETAVADAPSEPAADAGAGEASGEPAAG